MVMIAAKAFLLGVAIMMAIVLLRLSASGALTERNNQNKTMKKKLKFSYGSSQGIQHTELPIDEVSAIESGYHGTVIIRVDGKRFIVVDNTMINVIEG